MSGVVAYVPHLYRTWLPIAAVVLPLLVFWLHHRGADRRKVTWTIFLLGPAITLFALATEVVKGVDIDTRSFVSSVGMVSIWASATLAVFVRWGLDMAARRRSTPQVEPAVEPSSES